MNAIQTDVLTHHYQPIVSLDTGQISHYEVLLRMNDVDKKPSIPIFEYIEQLEKSGQISELDRWNVEALAQQVDRRFHAYGHPCSVNVSACTVQQPEFITFVNDVLSNMDNPQKLHFEITESQPISDYDTVSQFIDMVHQHGSEVAIDDFGAGYANFNYIDKLDADLVKIDGKHITQILSEPGGGQFVRETVKAAREKGMKVIAEFIEDTAVQSFLNKLGVDYGQGHLYSPAMAEPPSQLSVEENIVARTVEPQPEPEVVREQSTGYGF